jgi:hypothetical protein
MKKSNNFDRTRQVVTMKGIRFYGATSRKEFIYPILRELNSNKSGLTNENLQKVISIDFQNKFNKLDLEILLSGYPRWQKNFDWIRYQMKNDGLIKFDAKTKMWVITQKGIENFQNIKKISE